MRPPWKRRTPDDFAAAGDIVGLLAALSPNTRDFIEETTGVYDVGWERRVGAARHLADAAGEAVTLALTTALTDVTPTVRLEALRSLVPRADTDERVLVDHVLIWPEEDARAMAEGVLLDRAERNASSAARLLAAYARAGNESDIELSDAWVNHVAVLADDAGRASLVEEVAEDALEREASEPRVRQVLAAAADDAMPILVSSLARAERRPAAIRLLGGLRHDGATPALIEMIDEPARDVRRAAAVALGEIKDPHAIDALLRHTADEDYYVRDAALRALDGFGTAAVVWGLASVARGVLTGMTGDDWMQGLEPAEPQTMPQLPVVNADHVDAEADELTAEAAVEPLQVEAALTEPTAARRRRGFWR